MSSEEPVSSNPQPEQTQSPNTNRVIRPILFGGLALGLAAVSVYIGMYCVGDPSPTPTIKPTTDLGKLFAKWPQDKAPEVVLIFTGETYSYLQPCGCSRPQLGGLERRYNLLQMLKAKGWNVISFDLGDIADTVSQKGHQVNVIRHSQQISTKYQYMMKALEMMDVEAVGIGENEYSMPLMEALSQFTLQQEVMKPRLLSANLQDPKKNLSATKESMVGDFKIIARKNAPTIGVIGATGPELATSAAKANTAINIQFAKNENALQDALVAMDKAQKTDLKVLLYQGKLEQGFGAAQKFPGHFHLIITQSTEESARTDFVPAVDAMGKALMDINNKPVTAKFINVGHKGRSVAVVGVFKGNPGYELHYQSVDLGEEFETPDEKVKENLMLKNLEEYSKVVQTAKYFESYPKSSHPLQIAAKGAKDPIPYYVGSNACQACHLAEFQIWSESNHSHAYDTLKNKAQRPSLRNFDGECLVCHTVGFAHFGGYPHPDKAAAHINAKNLTTVLGGVGCENCHGPGSNHVSTGNKIAANWQKFALEMSPWKKNDPNAKLPEVATLTKILQEEDPVKRRQALQNLGNKTILDVNGVCSKCHDGDNDPKFELESYWVKIAHGNKQMPIPQKKK